MNYAIAGKPHHHIQPQRQDSIAGGQIPPLDGESQYPAILRQSVLTLMACNNPLKHADIAPACR